MNTQHTPGPWTVKAKLGSPSVVVGGVARQRTNGMTQDQIATAHNPDEDNGGEAAWFANAALIAAAPELLAALVELERLAAPHFTGPGGECPGLTLGEKAIIQARAAIAKAEGRQHPPT